MAVGAEVVQRLGQIRADLCLLGTNSIDIKYGITDLEWEIIEVKKAMIACSQKVVSLAIAEKLNTIQHLQVCTLQEIDMLITELDPSDYRLVGYKNADILVM
jgi:DeoR/GlpR family transcriptional regulator of sugar metabolism